MVLIGGENFPCIFFSDRLSLLPVSPSPSVIQLKNALIHVKNESNTLHIYNSQQAFITFPWWKYKVLLCYCGLTYCFFYSSVNFTFCSLRCILYNSCNWVLDDQMILGYKKFLLKNYNDFHEGWRTGRNAQNWYVTVERNWL